MADLGCWPGGWLQVASSAVGAAGRVVGVDKTPLVEPIRESNVSVLEADLLEPGLAERVVALLGGPADVVLSDAAPKLTGIRDTDRAREEELLAAIDGLLGSLLRPGGDLLLKILEGPEAQQVERRIRARFERARPFAPKASRKGSSERYLLARGFRA